MFIQQLYTKCLAQASYYIESGGEAAIIDPMREPQPYLNLARERKARIKYIFETHFHADFISGHLDLADKTSATIVFGPQARPAYAAYVGRHEEFFLLGDCSLQLLHTPGHTIESSCYLLYDEKHIPKALFSGDTLFVGDVGRPDLMSGNKGKEELASMMYDSLNGVIMKLPDHVLVYPGHGAGSACGKNLGIEKYSTIGEQKKMNYALQPMSREEFIYKISADLASPPPYFFYDASINIMGYRNLDMVLNQNMKALDVEEFSALKDGGAIVLDTRDAGNFAGSHIPGAINIGLRGEFAPWAGTLIDIESDLLIVADPGREAEVITRLARVGYENVKGFLNGSMETWLQAQLPLDNIDCHEAGDLMEVIENSDMLLMDVRRNSEHSHEYIPQATHIPLEELPHLLHSLNANRNYTLFCKGGYRSMIAASILKANGIKNIVNINGGLDAIKNYYPQLLYHQPAF